MHATTFLLKIFIIYLITSIPAYFNKKISNTFQIIQKNLYASIKNIKIGKINTISRNNN